LNPNLLEAHSDLGRALYSKGDVDEALEEFRTAVLLDPNRANVHYDLGIALTGY
jgi:Flp pilus assembly protein TadD